MWQQLGSVYWLLPVYRSGVSFDTFHHSPGLAKFPENLWVCLELVVWSNFSYVGTTGVRPCEVWSTTDPLGVRAWGKGCGGWRVGNLSTETDSIRCNGLLRLHQGFTTSTKTRTVFHWRSEKDMTPGQPGYRHLGTVGGRCPSAAGVLVGKLSDKRKFMCMGQCHNTLFLSFSAPRNCTQSLMFVVPYILVTYFIQVQLDVLYSLFLSW
jgi:hypothetical protein